MSTKGKILVSACLYGHNCKYDGTNNLLKDPIFMHLKKEGRLVFVCPEQLGGLPTPRIPCEIKDGRVYNKEGKDVTPNFEMGAKKTLEIAKENNVRVAIFKESSPSCGSKKIYDGTFSNTKISGMGFCARHLIENGIPVFNENEVYFAKVLADGGDCHH